MDNSHRRRMQHAWTYLRRRGLEDDPSVQQMPWGDMGRRMLESSRVVGIHTIVLRHRTWSVIPARAPSILVHHRALIRQTPIVVVILFLLVPCLLNGDI